MTIKYTTSTGHELIISTISPDYVLAIQKGVEFPEPPTYEFEVLGGTKETAPHTETTTKSEEDQLLWNDYKLARNLAYTTVEIKKARAVFRRFVDVVMPEDDAWVEIQKEDGIEVPDDPKERKLHYIKTECVGTETDVFAIVRAAEQMSQFSIEDYQHALELFRYQMEGDAD